MKKPRARTFAEGRAWTLLALGLLAWPGCNPSDPIPSGPLAGRIGGAVWTLASADTDPVASTPTRYFATMHAISVAPCSGPSSGDDQLLLSIPKAPGDYSLGADVIATFYLAATNDNLVAIDGHLKVDQLTASGITGGANVAFDGDNAVSGQFQITICP